MIWTFSSSYVNVVSSSALNVKCSVSSSLLDFCLQSAGWLECLKFYNLKGNKSVTLAHPSYYFCDIPASSDMRGSFPRSLWWGGERWRCWSGSEEGVVGGRRDPQDSLLSHSLPRGRGGRWQGAEGEGGIRESDNWWHLLNKQESNAETFRIYLYTECKCLFTIFKLNAHISHPTCAVRVSGCNLTIYCS